MKIAGKNISLMMSDETFHTRTAHATWKREKFVMIQFLSLFENAGMIFEYFGCCWMCLCFKKIKSKLLRCLIIF